MQMFVLRHAFMRRPNFRHGSRQIWIRACLRSYSRLNISDKVKRALDNGLPVVCLESTIITHGMEYPANLRMARAVEQVISDNGATPATIAILNGIPHVGLEDSDLEFLARTGKQARKISRRDMAACMADIATGGTTVSGTMILAKMAGIKVFVTGGIGGVHRGAEMTMDVSNDLNELSRNDVAVVCAGPKAILDIPLTLEYLETMGVTVTTIGQENLPAFYSRDSGIKSPQVSANAEHAARLISANQQLGLGSAVLVCVPIPPTASIDTNEMRTTIEAALDRAKAAGITGKDTTPFLLSAVSEATQGKSLEANISLVLENARVGAEIAVQLGTLQNARPRTISSEPFLKQTGIVETKGLSTLQSQDIALALADLEAGFSLQEPSNPQSSPSRHSEILVIGGVAVDTTCHINASIDNLNAVLYTSVPGTVKRSVGGVAGNIARAVAMTGTAVTLASIVGGHCPEPSEHQRVMNRDVDGQYIVDELSSTGVNLEIAIAQGARSATYTAVQARGELLLAVADMEVLTRGQSYLPTLNLQQRYEAIVFDGNIPDTVSLIANEEVCAPIVCFEPTSISKAPVAFSSSVKGSEASRTPHSLYPDNYINMTTPNIHELGALFDAARAMGCFEDEEWWTIINSLNIGAEFRTSVEQFLHKHKQISLPLSNLGVIQQGIHLLPLFQNIYLTMGSSGVLSFHLSATADIELEKIQNCIIQKGQDYRLYIVYHTPLTMTRAVLSDTGAGDTFTGILVSSLVKGKGIAESVKIAQQAAILTLASTQSVSPEIMHLYGKA